MNFKIDFDFLIITQLFKQTTVSHHPNSCKINAFNNEIKIFLVLSPVLLEKLLDIIAFIILLKVSHFLQKVFDFLYNHF